MRADLSLTTADRAYEVSTEYKPNEPLKDIVSNACDDVGLDPRELTSATVTITMRNGELS